MNESDVIVIGAGLTGLTLCYYLQANQISYTLLEARDRIGGRIHTNYTTDGAPLEHGATWLGKKHSALIELLKELNIGTFVQELGGKAIYDPISTSAPQVVQLPPNNDPSFRIQKGSSALIEAQVKKLDSGSIMVEQVVHGLSLVDEAIEVKTSDSQYRARYVVSTLPPNLFVSNIVVTPSLPDALIQVASHTHTWMGESIKVGLRYKSPFWLKENSSGTIVSNVGPIPEMYDHTDYSKSHFALKGFMNGSYFSLSEDQRRDLILQQLEKYYGEVVHTYTAYEEKVWRKEPYTFAPYSTHVLPHQNNGHHIYRAPFLDGRLFLGGSETATQHPGYMDGAVISAKAISQEIASAL